MKKFSFAKQLVSVLLCLMLTLSCLPLGAVAADTVTVYFNNTAGWQSVYAYAYNTDTSTSFTGSWPGTAMTPVDGAEGIYSIEFSSEANIIYFHDQYGSNTGDLTIPTDGANLYDYSTGTWSVYESAPVEPDNEYYTLYFNNTAGWQSVNAYAWDSEHIALLGAWPGTAMTPVDGAEGIYSVEVPTAANSIIFNDGTNQTADLTLPTDGTNLYDPSTDAWSIYGDNAPAKPNSAYTLYFNNNVYHYWSRVYAYALDSEGNELLGASPGTELTLVFDEKKIYSVEVPAEAATVQFFGPSSSPNTEVMTIPTDGRNMYDLNAGTWTTYTLCAHTYSNGICTICGRFELLEKNEDGYYMIGNAGQLYRFEKLVNEKSGYKESAVLTADIVLPAPAEGESNWSAIGKYKGDAPGFYYGVFDGAGHTISGIVVVDGSMGGFFGFNSGTIKNLGIINSTINAENGGGVCLANIGTIENCYSDATISGVYVGGVSTMNFGTIENCYSTGALSTTLEEGLVGGVCGQMSDDMGITPQIINSYYLDTAEQGVAQLVAGTAETTAKSADEFASGEVTYLLNGSTSVEPLVWKQTLGEQASPTFTGETVYQVLNCANATAYNNEDANLPHNFVNCVCTVCGLIDAVASVTTAEGAVSYYATLSEAVDAMYDETDATLTLLEDVTVDEDPCLPSGTLDLNGCTLTTPYLDINMYVTLTICDSSAEQDGAIVSEENYLTVYGNLTVESGRIESSNEYTIIVYDGKVTVNDGVIEGNLSAIYVYGGEVIVNGGTLTSVGDDTIGLWGGKATVTGGTLSGLWGIGIYTSESSLELSGDAVITSEYIIDLWLDDSSCAFTITGALTGEDTYSVYMDPIGVFAVAGEGYTITAADAAKFTSSDPNYMVVLENNTLSLVKAQAPDLFSIENKDAAIAPATQEGKYDITWNANVVLAEGQTIDSINETAGFVEYGAYYGTSAEAVQMLAGGTATNQARKHVFGQASEEEPDVTVYTVFGLRLTGVPAEQVRAAMFYITYVVDGVTYTEYSPAVVQETKDLGF